MPTKSGVVLLVGGAAHKRNEFAARVLAETKPGWLRRVEGVGVSKTVRATLEAAFGAERCQWHDRISDDELVAVYQRAEFFVLFSVEEGFGMPFVEALATGCTIIAIDQPLTREILGEAACLIPDGTTESVKSQILQLRPVAVQTRRQQAELYSWENFASAIEASVISLG